MEISFLIPSRNGAEFLEWSYNSIRKNQGNHNVEILILNDNSDKDNTAELLERLRANDPKLQIHTNTTGRMGISGGYAFLAKKVKTKYLMHFHNDMYLCEGALDLLEQYFSEEGDDVVLCLTRIEHSMGYQPGPEKIIWDNAPLELEDWNEETFLTDLPKLKSQWGDKYTGGHFAPFCMNTAEYHALGGVDDITFPLQSREDSDWAFRLVLAGFETIQVPAFVFHFASRGNRRNKYETNTLIDNPEWTKHNYKATRNFIRKWGTLDLHDEYLQPKIPKFYDVGFVIDGDMQDVGLINVLEPFCSKLFVPYNDKNHEIVTQYCRNEQPNTTFDLANKIVFFSDDNPLEPLIFNDVIVSINPKQFNNNDFRRIQSIHNIIATLTAELNFKQWYKMGNCVIEFKTIELTDYADEMINKHSLFLSNKCLANSNN